MIAKISNLLYFAWMILILFGYLLFVFFRGVVKYMVINKIKHLFFRLKTWITEKNTSKI